MLGHLEHGHLALATENSLESGVRVDEGLFCLILETVFLDVIPHFFGEFATTDRCRSDYGGKHGIRLNGFEKSCVWFAFGFFCGFNFLDFLSTSFGISLTIS